MYKYLITISLVMLIFSSCQKDESNHDASALSDELNAVLSEAHTDGKLAFTLPDATNYNAIPQDPNNPLTDAKVVLGRMLYHDPSFSVNPEKNIGMGTYSCASCHFSEGGFAARKAQGIGEGGIGTSDVGRERTRSAFYAIQAIDVQPIKSPSTLNTAYQDVMLWNGQFGATGTNAGTEANWTDGTPKAKNLLGFQGVETQALAGIEVHRLMYNDTLIEQNGYQNYFDQAYPEIDAGERYTNRTAALAIAAYERTLLPNEAPFQEWLRGNTSAMTDAQLKGAILFFDKANCIDCHTGPALNVMDFSAIGMNDLWESSEIVFRTSIDDDAQFGRGSFTGLQEDMYKFKVPQLYNLHDSPFYGHGASFTQLFDIIKYKSIANPENKRVPQSQIDPRFVPLNLSDNEISDLAKFVEFGLWDSNLSRYLPTALPSGSCFPNGDELSKFEMGCQ